MFQSPFLELPSIGVDKRNLLKARGDNLLLIMSIVRLLSPISESLWLVGPTKVYSDLGADIGMESIAPIEGF
jgi:hypothetical protein